jgi:hypothetical protein
VLNFNKHIKLFYTLITLFTNIPLSIARSFFLLLGAGLLVTIPVFLQAPLVRAYPWLSLVLTVGWFSLSRQWRQPWGSLLWGFALTWCCGSIYWGWYRFEPLWHLPMEALALPLALWGLGQRSYRVGSCFYLGSLWGTIVTDLYIWFTGLLPSWRALVDLEPDRVTAHLYPILLHLQNPWGLGLGVMLALSLVWLATTVLGKATPDRCVFAGAVLFTLVTDSLFGAGLFLLS